MKLTTSRIVLICIQNVPKIGIKKAFSSGVVCSAGVEVLLAPLIEVETSRIEYYLSRQITNRPQRSLEP